MCAWVVPPVAGLIELNVAPEIIAEDIGAIAVKNGRVTIYLYNEQMPLEGGEQQPMRVVSGKIVGELANVPSCLAKLALCLVGFRAPGIVPDDDVPKGPRLVKG